MTLTTYQFAQVLGFAAGGTLVGFFGTRTSLVVDSSTFVASAVIVRAWVRPRPATAATSPAGSSRHRRGDVQAGSSYYQEPERRDFHFRIVRASRNDWLFELLCGDLYDLLRFYRYQSSTVPGRTRQAYDEHRAIVAALAARDADAAEALMRRHIRNGRDQLNLGALTGIAPEMNPKKKEA